MKNEQLNVRLSTKEKQLLKQAAKKLTVESGKTQKVSGTLLHAVGEYVNKEPKPEKITHLVKESYFRNICSVHSMALPHLKRIAEAFKKLDIGPISPADMEQIEARNLNEIKSRYYANIEKGIPKNTSTLVRNNLLSGSEETFGEFQTISLNTIQSFVNIGYFMGTYYPLFVKHFTIQNNEVILTDENKEFLKSEHCTVYLETENQYRFIQLQEAALRDLMALKAMLLQYNIGNLFSQPGDVGLFDEGREDIILGSPEFVQYIK